MGPRYRRHNLGAIALLVGALGCRPDAELPPTIWEGDSIRFRTAEPPARICGGTFDDLDARTSYLQSLLETNQRVVDVVWAPGEAIGEFCDSDLGCSDGEVAFCTLAVCEHELFHAVRGATSHRGLEEGLATYFGDDREIPGTVNGDAESLLRAAGPQQLPATTDYPTLGHFASYVHSELGDGALAALDQRSTIHDGWSELDQAFVAASGVSVDELLADYRASYPMCGNRVYRHTGFECSQPAMVLPQTVGEELSFETRVDCDDAETVGPRGPEVWKTLALEVPMEGWFLVNVFPEEADHASIRFSTCDTSCAEQSPDPLLFTDFDVLGAQAMCFREGRVLMRLGALEDAANRYSVSFQRLDASEPCD